MTTNPNCQCANCSCGPNCTCGAPAIQAQGCGETCTCGPDCTCSACTCRQA